MTTCFRVAYLCPKCQTLFATMVVSSCSYAGKDTDFRPQYTGINPLPLFVHRCPNCNFVGREDEFEKPMEEISDEACVQLPQDPFDDGVQRYSDMAERMVVEGAEKLDIADVYLKAAWCARIDGQSEAERTALGKAAQLLTEALAEGSIEPELRAIFIYLVGELHRRCERFDQALNFFEQARNTPTSGEAREWLPVWIDRQAELARAQDASNTQFRLD